MSEARALNGSSGKTIAQFIPVAGRSPFSLHWIFQLIADVGIAAFELLRTSGSERPGLTIVACRQHIAGRIAISCHPAFLRCP